MICKYCHLNSHLIDKCPTIICKNCKDIGHPQWLCKLKKTNVKNKKGINESNRNSSIKKVISNISLESKYSFTDEIKKKQNEDSKYENIIVKNIDYYINLQNNKWGDLVNI
jgi:hypothetical protein